eukprot:1380184-Amphidinium_carterae.1
MKSYIDTATLEFDGTLITMKPTFYVSITMSPDYVGRVELPDNLVALFRAVAIKVSGHALIGRITFYEHGFADAQVFKFLTGLAFSGVLCCFDELNRINIEVLSVISQQLLVLLGNKADMKNYNVAATLEIDGTFITIALFRPVAMMVPDYALIGHIMFCEFGFAEAQVFNFFKVLAFSGAFSVIAQQLKVLFGTKADMKSYNDIAAMEFEGTLITMKPTINVFITMSPGYAGRAEWTDNLAACFHAVAMMLPDYASSGRICSTRTALQKLRCSPRRC